MLNKIMVIGHVGNVDVKTVNGSQVANISLATTKRWKTASGEKAERTEWHKIAFWNALAEIVSQYVRKGSKIYVEGEMQYEHWEKEGVKHKDMKIHATQMLLLDKKDGESKPTELSETAQTMHDADRDSKMSPDLPF